MVAMRAAKRTAGCVRCKRSKPVECFPPRSLSKDRLTLSERRSTVCWFCIEDEAWTLDAKKAKRRATWIDPVTGVVMRRCSKCREVKPLSTGFYTKGLACPGSRWPASGACKSCKDATDRAYRKRVPEKAQAWARAASRRRYKKMMGDSLLHAQYCEDMRLRHRLRAEAEGRQVRQVRPRVSQPTSSRVLPAAPLVALVDSIVDAREGTAGSICRDLGVSERTVREWRSPGATVRVGTAERILLNAGVDWSDCYPAEYAAHFLA